MPKEQSVEGEISRNRQGTRGLQAKRPRMSADERVAHNRKLLQQYGSHIIVPRSAECRILLQMVYPLNKAIPFLRRDLGVKRAVSEVLAILSPVTDWVKRVTDWLRVSGGELILMAPTAGESPGERERLVNNPRAHVIVPQTDEVRQVLEQAIRMDRVLVYLRMADMDQLREEPRLSEAFALVRELDEVVEKVCASVGVQYFSPKDMRRPTAEVPGDGLSSG